MTDKPEIRINFSHLLYNVSSDLSKLRGSGSDDLATPEQCEQWARAYREAWADYEEIVLEAMTGILGLAFYRDVIDVSLAPYFMPQSDPLIMHFRNEPDVFVDVLTHELIHVLLTDNNRVQLNSHSNTVNLFDEWRQLFGKEPGFKTLVHIPVHALHKSVYLDYLHAESRLQRDAANAKKLKNGESYAQSWAYVEAHGYKKIIEQLRMSYQKMEAKNE